MTHAPRTLRLPRRTLIDVSGPDTRPFLHRLLTQDVESLADGELRYAALLTPQGRVLYDLFLFGEADRVRVDVDVDVHVELMAKLTAFRLRAKVEITRSSDAVHALWGATSALEGWRRDPRTTLAGFRRAGEAPDPPCDAAAAEPADYYAHRLALGLPDVIEDGLGDRLYATEADLDLLNGVDYRKGCFIGQETTSRMKRRNGVRSRILPLDFAGDAPDPGVDVMASTLRAGEIVAAGGSRALALLRLDRATGALGAAGHDASVVTPPWAPQDLLVGAPAPPLEVAS